MSKWKAVDLGNLPYAVATHTGGNGGYLLYDLDTIDNLKTGVYRLGYGAKTMPSDYVGQIFGSVVFVMKFNSSTAAEVIWGYAAKNPEFRFAISSQWSNWEKFATTT